jgi:hypothetical protein
MGPTFGYDGTGFYIGAGRMALIYAGAAIMACTCAPMRKTTNLNATLVWHIVGGKAVQLLKARRETKS